MAPYWVVGGEYTDTRFETPAPGKSIERHGPFETYKEAYEAWMSRARATIDDCHARFRIVEGDGQAPGEGPPLEGTDPMQP